ncbi:hypothetical protein P170DRAFT_465953 [Aspergillus steynii IBT 23096]|uniref:Protein kinase domain-containing protein n=1 Tax=Aspergillus steynii IBT 23096 TaxID=1392250 RepID=A0A2I2G0M5_9EURO|nr:uncharacterized protein P170DRAFT_465953 [Aspergillus steynii IBT 23096]PLB46432.1 hypothetical protein P170DRAFT_465953 [Aspergillus steynii IBT 23096]
MLRRTLRSFSLDAGRSSLEGAHDQAYQQRRDDLIEELRTRLKDRMEKRGSSLEKFISRGSLQDIWSEDRLQGFIDLLAPGFNKNSIPDIRGHYIQTLSILVWIRWSDWSRFGSVFFRQGRADCNIPTYTLEILEEPSFLGPQWADSFFAEQYVFCPVDIVEGENIVQSEEWRLPFLDGAGRPRSGGFGEVVKESIARGHFCPLLGNVKGKPLNQDLLVARKSFATRHDFREEVKNLSLLRASLSKCERIVLSLATVTIGRKFNIIFPWADMDLEIFLDGGYKKFGNFGLHDLMKEVSNLAWALSFLHDGLQPRHLKCHHMDLKPPNILIFASDRFPVGEWKITDFGISIIDEPDRHPKTTTVSQLVQNKTYPPLRDDMQYRTSTYQPPEASTDSLFGRRSDVWSLGGILMRVLAFGLGGIEELQRLDEQRALNDDGLPGGLNDRFYRGSPPVLNPHVESWLNALPGRYPDYHQESLEKYKELLFRMLSIEKLTRPLAGDVFEELGNILKNAPPERNEGPARVGSIMTAQSDPPSDRGIGITATVASLVNAIKQRDILEIQTLLNGHVMVEETHHGDRPVIHAIRENCPAAIQMLRGYQRDLDLETPSLKGDTPLKLASEIGSVVMVETLLAAGVDIDATSQHGMTALMVAAKYGHGATIQTLLNHGANYMMYSNHGYTCVHFAAINRQAGGDVIRPFIDTLETLDIPAEDDAQTPFMMLIKFYTDTPDWWEKYDILREANANINYADADNMTPLSLAVKQNQVKLAETLMRHGARY